MKTVFLRVLDADDKATALLGAVREPERVRGRQRFELDPTSFASVPRSPFAYWITPRMRAIFEDLPRLEGHLGAARGGAKTYDDFRFVRLRSEAAPIAIRTGTWTNLNKGGASARFFFSFFLLINWRGNARELRAFYELHTADKTWGGFGRNEDCYYRPGVTWPLRTDGLGFRCMPAGFVFSNKGPGVYCPSDESQRLLATCAVVNSSAFASLVSLQLARTELAQSYEVGLIQTTPVPKLTDADRNALARLAGRAWSLKRSLDTRTETSHAFTLPALLQVVGADLAARAAIWSAHVRTVEAELTAIQADVDDRCFVLYGIDEADRRTITEGFGTRGSEEASSDGANDAEDDAGEDTDENESTADATGLAAELVSWAVGVAFGRFDIHLATGARPTPAEPAPFDPLPACSPAMLHEDLFLGARASCPPFAGETPALPGVLVDDLGHAQDLPTAVRAVFDVVFGAGTDRWWNDVAALLDPKGHDLRVWLAGSFFEHHLKRYSKSRRKAPIFWRLGTPSGRYSVWLYAHRLTRDSFFQLQNEVVGPKLTHEERQLTSLMQNAGGSPSALERKEIAAQEAFVEELRAMLDEIKRVAPLWNPNLDDGVVLTMAPLWRLVPQHKPWQKELKSKWDELAAGKYDWAHLAMHLWPERVVPKCATDRSLAIAHDLEDVFWVEGADGKWKARTTPVRPVDELVRERSSSAVKAALKSLLDVPTASGAGRARGRRAASPAAAEGESR